MAGSEKTGYNASSDFLFENAYYVLTPTIKTTEYQLDTLIKLVKEIKALPVVLNPDIHDLSTAAISHVPHVIASGLVNMVKELDCNDRIMHMLAAGGFKDITRIASSSPEIWEHICMSNKDKIIGVLEKYTDIVETFIYQLRSDNNQEINSFFKKAMEYRDSFADKKKGALISTFDVLVDVRDEPGIIARIATILSDNNINIKNIGIMNNRELEQGVLAISFYDEDSQRKSYELLVGLKYSVFIS